MTLITKRTHEEVTVMNCLKPKPMMFNTFILKYNFFFDVGYLSLDITLGNKSTLRLCVKLVVPTVVTEKISL